MLRKKEKQTLTRLFLLGVGAPIGLDRFYEGDVTGGFLAILGFLIKIKKKTHTYFLINMVTLMMK